MIGKAGYSIIIMILFATAVHGIMTDVAIHYTCDDGTITGTTLDSATGINDGTLYSTISTSSTAVIGESCHISTTNNYIFAPTDQSTVTLNFWYYYTSGGSAGRIYETNNDDFSYYEPDETITWFSRTTSTFYEELGTVPSSGWVMNTIMKNATGIYWYQNASYVYQINNNFFFSSGNLYLSNRAARDRGLAGYWDSVTVWNRSLTLQEIQQVFYAERIGLSYADGWVGPETYENHQAQAYEASTQEYTLQLINYEGINESAEATLKYAGKDVTASLTYNNATDILFTATQYAPWVETNQTEISYYWEYSVNGTTTEDTANYTQTILQLPRRIETNTPAQIEENQTHRFTLTIKNYNLTDSTTANITIGTGTYAATSNYTNATETGFYYDWTAPHTRINATEINVSWAYQMKSNLEFYDDEQGDTGNETMTLQWSANRAYITITAKDNFTGIPITTFSANITGDDYGTPYTYETTTGTIKAPQKTNVTRAVKVWADTYAAVTYNVTIPESGETTLEAQLLQSGTIWIRIYDETTGKAINGSEYRIINLDGDLDITNNTGTSNDYYLYVNETGNYTITAWQTGNYSERSYYELMEIGRQISLNIYLVPESEDQATTFTVKNSVSQLISDAQLSLYTTIGGELVKVAQKKTDFSGVAAVNLHPTTAYLLRVTHANYLQKEITFIPTSTSYTVYMDGTQLQYTNMMDGVDISISPTKTNALQTETQYSFIISISDAQNALNIWGVHLTYENGTEIHANSTDSTGGITHITTTTPENKTRIYVKWYYQKEGFEEYIYRQTYYTYPETNQNNTLAHAMRNPPEEWSDITKTTIMAFTTLGAVGTAAVFIGGSTVVLPAIGLLALAPYVIYEWMSGWVYILILIPTVIILFLTKGGET